MNTSENGIALIKQFEGCKLVAYQDSVGVWTIGFGDTGPDVIEGLSITIEDAVSLLKNRLAQEFETGVSDVVKVPLTQNQFDALVCFSYNVGLGNLRNSTLLHELNAGDYAGAAEQFSVWDKADGKTLKGLEIRRTAERDLFLQSS